jgi:putative two-component system response regulator
MLSAVEPAAEKAGERAPTIVVVDDYEPNLVQFARIAERLPGARVVCFESAEKTLRWMSDHEVDLVVADLHMPAPTGFDLVRSCKSLSREVPVIVVTGDGDPSARRAARALGVDAYFEKPVDRTRFLEQARRLLNEGEQRRARRSAAPRDIAVGEWPLRSSDARTIDHLFATIRVRNAMFADTAVVAALFARHVGELWGLSGRQSRALAAATLLHDIGMVGIPEGIIFKVGGLDARERHIVEDHPSLGHDILRSYESNILRLAGEIALTHHEHFDGKGYPVGLVQTAIPLSGRIAAVTTAYAAMISERPYRPALEEKRAVELIESASGTDFDPQIVEAFVRAYGAFPVRRAASKCRSARSITSAVTTTR